MHLARILLPFLIFSLSGNCLGTDNITTVTAKGTKYKNKHFRLRIIPRTPNQIAAFYEARGFPAFAISEVRQVCFITVGLGNESDQKLYHDLSEWKFTDNKGVVKRQPRANWKVRWNKLGLEKRFQSTFRWTLMPEKLDFYPLEGEGGNLIFPRTTRPITITARVRIGEPAKQTIYDVTIKNVKCAEDPK